uniref:Uncharacterized protein n=1 Tax=Anopheles epiroticus TaxID=199890 RepID=A0A182PP31_9DIPT
MSNDIPKPADQIQTNSTEIEDIEEKLPAYKVNIKNKLIPASLEIVDLTEDDFLHEFQSFLNTLPEQRLDINARKCATKENSRSVKRYLGLAAQFLPHVLMHQDTLGFEIFRIPFANAMLYGKLTAEQFRNDLTVYQLDDGSATVDVYYRPSNNQMIDKLDKLLRCEDTLQRKPSPLNAEAVPDSIELRNHLKTLISIAKARCNTQLAPLKLRSHCFVLGRPFFTGNGKVAVFAQTMLPDAEHGHSFELFWKCYLLSLYEPILNQYQEPSSIHETTSIIIEKLTEKMNTLNA